MQSRQPQKIYKKRLSHVQGQTEKKQKTKYKKDASFMTQSVDTANLVSQLGNNISNLIFSGCAEPK